MIIGITGTNGAGKGTVAEYLIKKHGFAYLSIRGFFVAEVVRRGKLASRNAISEVAKEFKAEHGPLYALEQLLAHPPRGNVVIESIRTKEEAAFLKSKGALLWSLDADMKVRYTRTAKRDALTGGLPFEDFNAEEQRVAEVREVMALADAALTNDKTLDELHQQIEVALAQGGVVDQR